MDSEHKHVRRRRYKGTHPKSFKEKYKELQPELYSEDVSKAISQGKTPAGMHRSICVNEIMEILNVKPGETGLDATLGYGGHALEILKRLQNSGRLFATDVDPFELPKTEERLRNAGYDENRLIIRKLNFSEIEQIFSESGPLDFVLADLGVSSMQIDNPDRGFTFKAEGPLDLRLDPHSGKSAAAFLKNVSREKLEQILVENSDEPFYEVIADAIIKTRVKEPVTTTKQLQKIIEDALDFVPKDQRKEQAKKACQRCFQALRIEVNDEFGALEKFLDKLPEVLAPGGRVAILSFHSGEDRRVKKAFKYFLREGIYSEISAEPIRASVEECNSNPRAKSAKLRWARK